MSLILKGINLPEKNKGLYIHIFNGKVEIVHQLDACEVEHTNAEAIQIPKEHGRLIEEHYPGELKAKQPKELFIMYRSADEDSNRFMFEAEAEA